MYAVRNADTGTRWAQGNYSEELGYYIKYSSEFDASSEYKKAFEESGLSIDDFYRKHLVVEGFQNKTSNKSTMFFVMVLLAIVVVLLNFTILCKAMILLVILCSIQWSCLNREFPRPPFEP
jgi:hypothetical protein